MSKYLRFGILPQTKRLFLLIPGFKLSVRAECTIPSFCKRREREDVVFCASTELVCLLWGRSTHHLHVLHFTNPCKHGAWALENFKPYNTMMTCHLPRFHTCQILRKINSFITKVAKSLCFILSSTCSGTSPIFRSRVSEKSSFFYSSL